jgi:catechol 2,3-dioxygenase
MNEKTLQATSEPAAAPTLPAATGVGAVHIDVTDGPRALEFYQHAVGLTPLSVEDSEIRLGAGSRELVILHPGAVGPVVPHHTGLYHLALLVPNRRELARVIGRLGMMRVPNSPTDHTMTKSDYLWDFDGNGIEIYCESPEDGSFIYENGTFAARDSAGRMRSGRDPIDLEQLFGELKPDDDLDAPMPDDTRMGHVHLHVRNVAEAVDFYQGVVGFDLMGLAMRYSVAFVSAGGYHHHLGLNTWAGEGAPPAPPNTSGLRHYTVELPGAADAHEVAGRIRETGAEVVENDAGYRTQDPSGNRFQLGVRTA